MRWVYPLNSWKWPLHHLDRYALDIVLVSHGLPMDPRDHCCGSKVHLSDHFVETWLHRERSICSEAKNQVCGRNRSEFEPMILPNKFQYYTDGTLVVH